MLIVDTGPFVAIANDQDPDHQASRAVLEAHPGPLITTTLVIAESGWLIRRQLGIAAEAALYTALSANEIIIETLTAPDWHRISELIDRYQDIRLDAADASIIAIAERLNLTTIATLDKRDFRIVRPAHTTAFELIPTPT